MFIEVSVKPNRGGPGVRTLVRATSIVLITERCSQAQTKAHLKYDVNASITLSTGEECECEESVEEILDRIHQAETTGSSGYSVTLEGTGFSTTTMVPSS